MFLLNFRKILRQLIGKQFYSLIKKNYKILKIIIFKIIEKCGFVYLSNPYYLTLKDDKSYKNLNNFFNKKNGRYLEIGGFNGYFESPTYSLHSLDAWRGVLIEPNNETCNFIKYYRPKDEYINCACSSFEETREKKYVEFLDLHHSGEIYFSDGELDDWALNEKRSRNINPRKVKLKNLTEIINNSILLKGVIIDLIVIDVEGYELNVLKGIDFSSIKINYLLIESRSINHLNEIKKFLKNHNFEYLTKTCSFDYLYINNSLK